MIRQWRFSETVCWTDLRSLAFIYLQRRIDGPCVFTPVFTPHLLHFTYTRALCRCKVPLMVCVCVFFFFRSLSYVTCMGCFSFLLLGAIYFVPDVKCWWAGKPFIFPGTVPSQGKGFWVMCQCDVQFPFPLFTAELICSWFSTCLIITCVFKAF